jgi:hypothetical protein
LSWIVLGGLESCCIGGLFNRFLVANVCHHRVLSSLFRAPKL